MKPVDLSPVRAGTSSGGSDGSSSPVLKIGAIAAVLVFAVGGYFSWARVTTVKEEAASALVEADEARSQDQQVQSQLREIGEKPVKQGWDTVAGTLEHQVVSQVQSRSDFPKLIRDLRLVVPADGVSGLTSVTAGSVGNEGDSSMGATTITIEGIAPDVETVIAILSNIDATDSMDDARITNIESIVVKVGGRKRVFRKFEISAALKIGGSGSSSGGDGGSQTVSNGGDVELQLDSEPTVAGSKKHTTAHRRASSAPTEQDSLDGLINDTGAIGGG